MLTLWIGLVVWLSGCLYTCDALASQPLRVMSFNIRYDAAPGRPSEQANAWLAKSGKHRRDLALNAVTAYDPDILGVQEALKNQIRDLQKSLPGHSFYGVGRSNGREQGEYCGIFVRQNRFAIVHRDTFWLNEDADEPGTFFPKTCCARIASWVVVQDLKLANCEYIVLNTHWDHQVQEARLFSARLIRQRLLSLAGKRPIVVMGDLNATADNPAFVSLLKASEQNDVLLYDSYRELHPHPKSDEGTFHGFRGDLDGPRIDYILHSAGLRATRADIIRAHDGVRYPSDHFPVTATLVLDR